MSNPNKPSKKLIDKWYAKAKRAGFSDIERNENDLKTTTVSQITPSYRRDAVVLWEAKADYYRLAEHFLNEYSFESDLEQAIWEYHVNGMSARDISITLKKARITKLTKTPIHAIIQRLSNIMKDRYLVNSKDRDGH